ncbi:3-oxoacyl-ACP reductase FabG [Sphaerobacter thermophilus]|jgi:3-oxoacyl-[acyl-carrier protein] reductase|uniref:3-oxoacyl-ACP reductase FabG n=1 Tax=Sphaerobacter thermophilus TaxID=2057 RepID=UPI000DB49039|nr:MAG: 3-oxoacyl-ACP reductase FabG [Sphaerobacter thermophilus]
MSPNRLEGKVAIVTGAAKGIGKGIARVLAAEGAKVVIADVDEARGMATAEELRQAGHEVDFIRTDVTKRSDAEAMASFAVSRFGGLHILCANAGIFPSARIEDMTEADWDLVHNINLKGTFFTVQACLPHMRQQRYGKIVVTSSITGPVTGFPGWAHYGASKAGQMGFIRTLAIEVARDNITVNAVQPGNIRTEGMEDVGEEYIRQAEAVIPMGRLGTPEDVAYAVLFLASDESNYITGHAIVVDGGQILPESPMALS